LEWVGKRGMRCFPLAWHYWKLEESKKGLAWIIELLRRKA
jgi:hypothetical protein